MNVAVRLPVGDEGAGSGIHTGHFSGDRLRGFSPCFNFPVSYTPLPLSARVGASPPTRGNPGASSSPGMRNFVMFPARASWRAGERYKGPSRKCSPGLRRTRRASLGAQATGGGAPTSGLGECPCPPRHSPSARGRFSPLPRHFADAPRRRAWAPSPPSVPGPDSDRGWVSAGPWPLQPWASAGWWPRLYPRLGTSPAGPLCHHYAPSYPRYKGRGRGGAHPHARPFPVLRTRPAPHHERGVVLVYASAGREGAARGWGRRRRVG